MATRDVSGWTVGFAVFAGVMLMMIGVFHALAGLAAIIDDQFFVVSKNYAFEFDTTAWGWIHLIYGAILVFAGYRIFSGVAWARSWESHSRRSARWPTSSTSRISPC